MYNNKDKNIIDISYRFKKDKPAEHVDPPSVKVDRKDERVTSKGKINISKSKINIITERLKSWVRTLPYCSVIAGVSVSFIIEFIALIYISCLSRGIYFTLDITSGCNMVGGIMNNTVHSLSFSIMRSIFLIMLLGLYYTVYNILEEVYFKGRVVILSFIISAIIMACLTISVLSKGEKVEFDKSSIEKFFEDKRENNKVIRLKDNTYATNYINLNDYVTSYEELKGVRIDTIEIGDYILTPQANFNIEGDIYTFDKKEVDKVDDSTPN